MGNVPILEEKSATGRWELTVDTRRPPGPSAVDKWTIDSQSLDQAKKDAIERAFNKYKPQCNAVNRNAITVTKVVTLREPPNATVKNVRDGGEDVLGKLATSTEFAKIGANLKKLTNIAKKLGGVANVLLIVDVANDIAKLGEYLVKYKNAKNESVKKDLEHDMLLIGAKLFKTGVTTVFPLTAWIDLGCSTILKLGEAMTQEAVKSMNEKSDITRFEMAKAKYDKDFGVYGKAQLSPSEYEKEVRMYARGFSKEDIKYLREINKDPVKYWMSQGLPSMKR